MVACFLTWSRPGGGRFLIAGREPQRTCTWRAARLWPAGSRAAPPSGLRLRLRPPVHHLLSSVQGRTPSWASSEPGAGTAVSCGGRSLGVSCMHLGRLGAAPCTPTTGHHSGPQPSPGGGGGLSTAWGVQDPPGGPSGSAAGRRGALLWRRTCSIAAPAAGGCAFTHPCCPRDPWSCADVAAAGHLGVLQWLRSQRPACPWDAWAAKGGHTDVLAWLRAQHPPAPGAGTRALRQ